MAQPCLHAESSSTSRKTLPNTAFLQKRSGRDEMLNNKGFQAGHAGIQLWSKCSLGAPHGAQAGIPGRALQGLQLAAKAEDSAARLSAAFVASNQTAGMPGSPADDCYGGADGAGVLCQPLLVQDDRQSHAWKRPGSH